MIETTKEENKTKTTLSLVLNTRKIDRENRKKSRQIKVIRKIGVLK